MNLYWGDLHTHCAISYGYGSLDRAFKLGREHLDFCSVVGHATWHDMPTDRERHGLVIDYHKEGFARLAKNWKTMQETVARYNEPGRFVTFLSYEWHSNAYGDHNIYYLNDDGEIVERDSLEELDEALDVPSDPRPARRAARLPAPEGPKTSPMPANNGRDAQWPLRPAHLDIAYKSNRIALGHPPSGATAWSHDVAGYLPDA